MFDAVTESLWLPLYDFDFWSLPYLRGKGVEAADLKPALRTSQRIMRERDSTTVATDRLRDLEARFAKEIAELDIAPARFAL
jgi:p-methyltransferase